MDASRLYIDRAEFETGLAYRAKASGVKPAALVKKAIFAALGESDPMPPRDPESTFGTKQPATHLPLSITPDLDPPGADRRGLTPEEVAQFREQGYVIKRGLIPKEISQPFHDLWWQQPPARAAKLDLDDPSSWGACRFRW